MHDVATPVRTSAPLNRTSPPVKRGLLWKVISGWAAASVCFVVLNFLGLSMVFFIGPALAVGAITFAALAYASFRRGTTPAGAILAVVAAVCVLFGLKGMQFGK